MEKRKILPLPGIEPRPPVARCYIDRVFLAFINKKILTVIFVCVWKTTVSNMSAELNTSGGRGGGAIP
jgi:hypothetical protein